MNETNSKQLDATLAEAWENPENLPEMGEWLKENRSEAAQAQYAFIIMKKHFARNHVELRNNEVPMYWGTFAIELDFNIHSFVSKKERSEMLKAMFVELVDFCEAFSGEFFASNLLEFLENFIDRDPPFSLIVPLLPKKALEKLDEMNDILDARHEDFLERQNQMGY